VGDGFLVYPLFTHMDEVDKGTNPFLMLDYAAPQYFEPNNGQPRGVGEHPHKGLRRQLSPMLVRSSIETQQVVAVS